MDESGEPVYDSTVTPTRAGIPDVVRQLRRLAGKMTQEQLADKADLAIGTIRNLEQGAGEGSNPKFETLQKLADGLGISAAELVAHIEAALERNQLPTSLTPMLTVDTHPHRRSLDDEEVRLYAARFAQLQAASRLAVAGIVQALIDAGAIKKDEPAS